MSEQVKGVGGIQHQRVYKTRSKELGSKLGGSRYRLVHLGSSFKNLSVCFFGKKVHSYHQEAQIIGGKKPLRTTNLGFLGSGSDKEPTCRRPKRLRFNPWVGRSPVGRHGNPLQYSCLENPRDRGDWRATVHRDTKSRTWLRWLSTHTHC